MNKKTYRIGLFGFGTLGSSLYRLILQSSLPLLIDKVCIQDPKKNRGISGCHFTTNKEEILEDEEIDIVVELINDDKIAFEIAKRSLEQGKSFVSANKKMIANNLFELHDIASKNNRSINYEAAVCAAIPLLKSIDHHFQFGELFALKGIFNGSTNYILSAMYSEGMSYNSTVEKAIEEGFAEEDSWLDISGADPNYKSCILAYHAFGKIINPKDTTTRGIQGVSDLEIRLARQLGAKIKLVSSVENLQSGVQVITMPRLITSGDELFNVDKEFNGVKLESTYLGNQFYLGKGAGGYPSSGSVLSDILTTLKNPNYRKRASIDTSFKRTLDGTKNYYLRVHKNRNGLDIPGKIRLNLGEDSQFKRGVIELNVSEIHQCVKMLSNSDFIMEIPSEYLQNNLLARKLSEELIFADS